MSLESLEPDLENLGLEKPSFLKPGLSLQIRNLMEGILEPLTHLSLLKKEIELHCSHCLVPPVDRFQLLLKRFVESDLVRTLV